eukprot:gene1529-1867_t
MAKNHGALRMLVDGQMAAFQPADASGPTADTLSVALTSGQVVLGKQPLLGTSAQEVLGLMGLFQFKAGAVLAVITQAQQAQQVADGAQPDQGPMGLIKHDPSRRLRGSSRQQQLLRYLQDAICPSGTGRNLFFAYNLDLTLKAQAMSDVLASSAASKSIAARADKRFFWNRVMSQPLMVVPSVLTMMVLKQPGRAAGLVDGALDRAGTRHWRRGADQQGSAANFVETEQLVTLDQGRVVASYVQCRGSIPLLWSQIPNIKYKPTTRLLAGPPTSAAFDAHIDALLKQYQAVCCINLVNQHGSEGQLEKAFAAEARRSVVTGMALRGMDGHGGHSYWAKLQAVDTGAAGNWLAMLWQKIQPEYRHYGQFMTGTAHTSRQAGVFRINCVDCLDRTNVVQGLLGRHALQSLLVELGVLQLGEELAVVLPQVESQFKVLWADHGDDISRQYAGTGALKSGFTRTGKRTLGGLIDDGVKSLVRYYLNNFQRPVCFTTHCQQKVLHYTGRVKRDVKLRFQRQYSPVVPILVALSDTTSSRQGSSGIVLAAVGARVFAPLLLAASLVMLVVKNGKMLVDRPQLCPQLANTVAYAEQAKQQQ